VLAALRAACERLDELRRREALLAWLDSARRDAPDRPSRFRRRNPAWDCFLDGRLRREDL
jgi:hypothetical protein